jgi:hypothetical protein
MCRFSKSCSTSQSTSNSTIESSSGPSTANEITTNQVTANQVTTNKATTNEATERWPPTSFHLFPNLPAEIRLKIWNYSILMTPRMVRIHVVASPTMISVTV